MDWFEELAKKIAEEDPSYLIENSKKIPWKWDGKRNSPIYEHPLLDYGDQNIDPFSFFYTVASWAKSMNSARRVFDGVSDVFKLTNKLNFSTLENFVFPTPSFKILFHGGAKGTFYPDLLWNFFRLIVSNSEDVESELFERVLSIQNVGISKLTQTMFLISPKKFFPLDKHMFEKNTQLFEGRKLDSTMSWNNYLNCIEELRSKFGDCELYEINHLIFLISKGTISFQSPTFFQLSTNAFDNDRDYWDEFKENSYVYFGGQSSNRQYKFNAPSTGDVLLVRKGQHDSKGIGVVLQNEYTEEFSPDHRIHVVWMNKRQCKTDRQLPRAALSRAVEVEKIFRDLPDYRQSFEFLDRLIHEPLTAPPATSYPLNQILFGPPGTGKTWNAERRAVSIVEGGMDQVSASAFRDRYEELAFDLNSGSGQIAFVTFHQNFAYEDFIEGIRPVLKGSELVKYELRQGIFKQICNVARERPDLRFVLIIDEINRGNIAKILGELITLIEQSRRLGNDDETKATLPYSGELFGVPKNLYIIGTMNTADRSIQLLDTALRRRFQFDELMPDCEHSGISRDCDGVDCSKMLQSINEKITVLLDREHQIGHTYLLGVNTVQELAETFKHRIFPLLQEYFFDDWSKIRTVLGNNGFVTKKSVEVWNERAYQDDDSGDVYERTPFDDDVWENLEEYRKIYNTQ